MSDVLGLLVYVLFLAERYKGGHKGFCSFFYFLLFSCTIYTAPAYSVAVLWDLKSSISG
jgi:hypothetical protein